MTRGAGLLCILGLVSCAGRPAPTLPDGPLGEGALAAGLEPQGDEERGSLERAALERVLAAGPQAFVRRLRVSPALLAGRFVGFRIDEDFDGDALLRPTDLRPGDVITRVNGARIEKPEDFMRVWESLGAASELRIEYVRGSAVRMLRWRILDGRALPARLVD